MPRPELPTFSIAEVKQHSAVEDRLWVTYKGGVYDVTDLAYGHPGGDGRLAMAGGNDVAIFWDVYRMHYQPHVLGFLEKFRIGNVTPQDAMTMEREFVFQNPFSDDPVRPNPDLLHTTEAPFNGEPLFERIGESFYTPNDLHYVRLHMPVAYISPKEWEVVVTGTGVKETTFSLKDIQTKFKHHEVACTLQCAGNRRQDFQDLEGHAVFIAPQWRGGAISNAKYKGVYLRDVLAYCGLDVEKLHTAEFPDPKIRHIQLEGTDATEDGINYGISIPIEKAVDPRGDCMLVWEMNGVPLPLDHGAPVRHLCPGHVGNKSAKFLEKIIVSDVESKKPWHYKSYRNFPPNVTFQDHLYKWDKLTPNELKRGPICQLMPVQSLITFPPPNAILGGKMDSLKVKGIAWTGNGVGMARVDVSLDGGKHFTSADLMKKPDDVELREVWQRKWSWSLFEAEIPFSEEQKKTLANGERIKLDLTSKGVDNQFNVQPSEVLPYVNPRGVVVNNFYHVPIFVDPRLPKGSVERCTGENHFNPPTGGHCLKPFNNHGWTAPEALWHADVMAGKK